MIMSTSRAAIGSTAHSVSLLFFAHDHADGRHETGPISLDAFEDWEHSITAELSAALEDICSAPSYQPNNAIVQVEFGLDRQGRPTDFSVLPGDGNWGARSASTEALKRLEGVANVPVNDPLERRFIANIVFFADPTERVRLTSELKRRHSRYLTMRQAQDRPFMLGS